MGEETIASVSLLNVGDAFHGLPEERNSGHDEAYNEKECFGALQDYHRGNDSDVLLLRYKGYGGSLSRQGAPLNEQGIGARVTLLDERMARPIHQGPMEDASVSVEVGNPACGDVLRLHLHLHEGIIRAASFESLGSPYQVATADILCDCVTGQAIDEARGRTPDCVLEKVPDLPRRSRYLARLAIDALNLALDRHERPQEVQTGARLLGDGEAEATVRAILAQADGDLSTRRIQEQLEADGLRLPGSTPRFLERLQQDGIVEARPCSEGRHWHWRLVA